MSTTPIHPVVDQAVAVVAPGGFATIQAAEYFVDTDPGEGNGTAFQAQDGAFDSEVESILPKDLNVTGLTVGPHLVGVRYQDNNNTWGEVLYQTIHVYDANPSGGGSGGGGGGTSGSSGGFATIQAAEYFVDTDPGEGNGTAFQALDGAFDSEVESILPKDLNVTGLTVGPHLVGVRYQDNNNTWGEVLYQTIHVYDANPEVNASGSGGGSGGMGGFTVIAGAEYFIGNDPGEGNATALQPKDGAFDSEVESTLTASLSLNGYALGTYLVGVRYMDNEGTWGDVLYKTIEVDVDTDGDGLADKAEAFYETNATLQDTDGDGYLDGEEVALGSDPLDYNNTAARAPTNLALDKIFVFENQQPGTLVGNIIVFDPNLNDSHTLALIDENGSALDKALFTIDANGSLRTTSVLDYEDKWLLRFRVRATDPTGFSIERTLGVAVRNDISDDNHRLLAFGSNSGNSLGIDSQNVPLLVAPAGSGFEKVVAGAGRGSLFIKSDGSLWGAGSYLGGKTPTEIWAPVNSMLDLSPPIQPVGITPETMLSGPARTDRFGPSVLVFTAGSETVMLTSTHLTTLNNFFLPVFRPWPPEFIIA